MSDFGDECGLYWDRPPAVERKNGKRTYVPIGPPPDCEWSPPESFPILSGEVVIDVETKDPHLRSRGPGWCFGDGEIVGVAVAWAEGAGYYPVAHEGGGNLDRGMVFRWLGDQLRRSEVQVICHNAGYDLGWLRHHGIRPARPALDTWVATALLDENRRSGYNLDAVAKDYIGYGKDETLLKKAAKHYGVDAKNELWRLPAHYVGAYGEGDAVATQALWKVLKEKLNENDERGHNLWGIFQLETDVTQVLLDMRERGVRVDLDKAERVKKDLAAREEAAQIKLNGLAGAGVNVNANDSLAKAFDKRNVPYPCTDNGTPSFRKEWLKACPDPIAKYVLEVRKLNKTRSTFIQGYILDKAHKGRIHAQFNQLPSDDGGTVSGRYSSSNPNLQNLPAKDEEIGPMVRGLFLPEEGCRWLAADYSAQEPRLAVHFAYQIRAPGSREAVEAYRENPRLDLHQWVSDLMAIPRPDAKIMNLAIMYGRGEASICRALGLPTEWVKVERQGTLVDQEVAGPEGKALIDQYHARMGFMRFTSNKVKRVADERGYIFTLLGRRCRFGRGCSPVFTAFNRLIQGSAADQGKKAAVDSWRAGYLPLALIHDEQGNSVESDKQVGDIKNILETCVQLEVPSVIDVALGPSWGEAM